MEFNYGSLSQNDKYRFILCCLLAISFVLPWWENNSSIRILNQTASSNTTLNGFHIPNFFIGFGASIASIYFLISKNQNSLWSSLGCILYAANVYFGWIGFNHADVNADLGGYGSANSSSTYGIGFYVYAISAAALMYLELKGAGYIMKDSVPPSTISNANTTNNTNGMDNDTKNSDSNS